jgi:hypothetical protein
MKVVVSFHPSDGKLYEDIKDYFYPNPEIEIYGRNLVNHFKLGAEELHNNAAKLNDRLSNPDLSLVLLSQKYLNEDWLSSELYALFNLEGFRNEQGKLVLVTLTSDITFKRQHQSLKGRINPDIDFRKDQNDAMKALDSHIQNIVREKRAGIRSANNEQYNRPSMKGESVYNVHGNNPRINIYSEDKSLNISNQTSENVFADMRQAIQTKINNIDERTQIINKLDELEAATGTDTFKHKYKDFIDSAADHMRLISPFIPALTQLLVG